MSNKRKIENQAQQMMEALNSRLANSTYTNPVTMSYSSGDPLLTIDRSSTALGDWCLILFSNEAVRTSGATDVLGLTQAVYSPHVIKVLIDNDDSDGTAGTVSETILAVLGEAVSTGMTVELYEIDAAAKGGNAYLEVGDMTSTNFVGRFNSLIWGLTASV